MNLPAGGLAMEPVQRSLTVSPAVTWRLRIMDVGLACCAMEFLAATERIAAAGAEPFAPVREAELLVVSGTVTAVMAPAVRAAYEEMSTSRRVLSFGACANSGGPYWDSYSVVAGVDSLVPVDAYVAGCPPRPEALLAALRELELSL